VVLCLFFHRLMDCLFIEKEQSIFSWNGILRKERKE